MRAGEVSGDAHLDGDKLIAASAAAQEGDALAAQAEHRAGLGALGYVELDLAVERGHLDLRAEGGLGIGKLLLHDDGGAVALKDRVRPHDHVDEQIAGGAAVCAGVAVALAGDGLPVVDAGGDLHGHLVLAADAAHTAAGLAGLVDDLARAAALGAGGGGLHRAEGGALGGAHGAAALAVGADLRRRAGGAAVALAVGALLHAGSGDLLFATEGRLLKGDVHAHAHALALAGGVRVAGLAAEAAEAAENVPKNIAEIAKAVKAAEAARAVSRVGIEGRMAKLVILLALFLVGEHLVGLVCLLEALLARLVAGVQVGVVGLGDLAEGLFDLVLCGALVYAEHLIVIAFFCHIFLLRANALRGIPQRKGRVIYERG